VGTALTVAIAQTPSKQNSVRRGAIAIPKRSQQNFIDH
jgi:hypothetical protein